MTTVSYALGVPPAATARGGDCRARDLDQGRNVHSSHRFAATTHCRISNGLLRLTVGAAGAAPALVVAARRGRVAVGDIYTDTYSDTYGGEIGTPAWMALGTITIDSPSVTALLSAVRIVRTSPESLTLRLVAPAIRDAFVTLRRGEPMIRIQHGATRPPFIDTDRRVTFAASPSPVGSAALGRVEEVSAGVDGMLRFVASVDAVTADAGAFGVTAASVVSARFAAGAGAYTERSRPVDLHRQLADAATQQIVVA